MTLREIVEKLDLQVHAGAGRMEVTVARGYMSDMLSDVIGNAPIGGLWITMQKHKNVVAVAVMKSLAAIVLVQGRVPEEDTLRAAEEEEVVILGTTMSAFALAARLHDLGIAGD
ncbi:MAG: serine kinase [Candidatus Eisenbacteria bacterium]|uniref:Serine kinase n=1 Tax=Eiseniibacteriota bacterium TaxID=2212470 RepID=A0A937XBD9_UNCEI|nr:serine kinase [Candidatus Eisenbacteria bacterium]